MKSRHKIKRTIHLTLTEEEADRLENILRVYVEQVLGQLPEGHDRDGFVNGVRRALQEDY